MQATYGALCARVLSQRYEEGCSRGVPGLRRSRRRPCRLQGRPSGLAPWRPNREGSALLALNREPRPLIGTGGSGAKPARTLSHSGSPFTGSYDRAPHRNGLRWSFSNHMRPVLREKHRSRHLRGRVRPCSGARRTASHLSEWNGAVCRGAPGRPLDSPTRWSSRAAFTPCPLWR